MRRTWTHSLACLAVLAGLLAFAQGTLSRQATPIASTEGLSLAASGLENPRGFAWGPDGALYIAEASIAARGAGATPVASPGAAAGLDGDIVRVTGGACPVVYQGNLPSSAGQGAADLGPASIVVRNGQVYLLDEGGGASHGNPLTPDGIYLIPGDGSARVVADLGAWVAANPVADAPADTEADGDLTAMVGTGDGFLVLESNGGQVIRVEMDGTASRFADLSVAEARPAGIALAPDGSVLVGLGDRVVAIDADGASTDAWTGLDRIVDIAVSPNGTLYALEASGSVVRQSTADASKVIAKGFANPAALAFGPDGALYVSSPASGGTPGIGSVVRINLAFGAVLTMGDALLEGSTCMPTPTPTATATPATTATATGTPDGDATSTPAGGTTVTIDNYAFSPATLTISAGTTVTWVNNDTAAHTVTAVDGSFDSGNLAPGESFTHTFTDAGTFDYLCNYHPNMTATVVVD